MQTRLALAHELHSRPALRGVRRQAPKDRSLAQHALLRALPSVRMPNNKDCVRQEVVPALHHSRVCLLDEIFRAGQEVPEEVGEYLYEGLIRRERRERGCLQR